MGFYFSKFEKDKKQHLNLSESAWLVIDQDITDFYLDKKQESLSGFLNRILSNFYQEADASINLRCEVKAEEIRQSLSSDDFKTIDSDKKELLISDIISMYRSNLRQKAKSYQKGHGEKFRINVSNVDLLRDYSTEDSEYAGSIGLYLKAIFEEYALLPSYKRELIFFKEVVDTINEAIVKKKKLRVTLKSRISASNGEVYARSFYFSPYKIVQDPAKIYNYAVGVSEEILDDGTITPKAFSSLRVSRMDKSVICSSKSGFISETNKKKIDMQLLKKMPQFLVGDLIDVKVRLTKKGYENYCRQPYLRPNLYDRVGDDSELIFVFHCTEIQAINYFLKFGRDVEILDPLTLREKFIERYRTALEAYKAR